MTEHTKGPWHVEYELDENREKTNVIFIAHPETECDMTAIAHLYHILGTDEENKANAYLMAAAPDMLEALKNVQHYISVAAISGFTDKEALEAVFISQQLTSAAIKKAKG